MQNAESGHHAHQTGGSSTAPTDNKTTEAPYGPAPAERGATFRPISDKVVSGGSIGSKPIFPGKILLKAALGFDKTVQTTVPSSSGQPVPIPAPALKLAAPPAKVVAPPPSSNRTAGRRVKKDENNDVGDSEVQTFPGRDSDPNLAQEGVLLTVGRLRVKTVEHEAGSGGHISTNLQRSQCEETLYNDLIRSQQDLQLQQYTLPMGGFNLKAALSLMPSTWLNDDVMNNHAHSCNVSVIMSSNGGATVVCLLYLPIHKPREWYGRELK